MTFNIIERAIWLRTWLALREFRVDGQGGEKVRRLVLAAPHLAAGASRP
ncbi:MULTISPECIES: hypothetical protein [unclassified Rhodanobacter]|nr:MULTISPECIES: hypothetical protein [unclassified Rhodanobacter]MBT2142710.1 hypothetical protein [Rhodanobacter sp. LX-99]MBT2148217.1 hypothetical protein [Rhodanobacter sp. LX-100]